MRKTLLIVGVIAIFSTVSVAQSKNDTIQQLQRQIINLENLNSRLSSRVNAAVESIEGEGSSFYFTLPNEKPLYKIGSSEEVMFDESP